MRGRVVFKGFGGLAVAACLAPAVHAQSVDNSGKHPKKAGNPNTEEVVVTAERRAVNVQKTPISIVALSGRTLAERGVQDINSLQTQVPSVSFVDNGNTKYVNIRGVGLDESSPNQTNGVAVNIDGAYVAREFNLNDPFFDLSDVEVLRGPQGTFQGQNASGGAIYINSAAPKLGTTTGFADFSYGSYNHYTGDAAVNVPLSDIAAIRVSVFSETRDSFFHNSGPGGGSSPLSPGNQPGALTRVLARAQLLLQPLQDLKIRLIEQHSDYLSDGPTFKSFNGVPGQKPFDLNYDTPQKLDINYNRVTAIVDWDRLSAFRVHAVVAYQNTDQQLHQDTDETSPFVQPSVPQSTNDIHLVDHYYTGELDLISKDAGRLDWTAGATFLDYTQKGVVHPTTYNNPADPSLFSDPNSGLVIFVQAPRQNQAVFAEGGYKILSDLELKIGGRFNHDRLGFDPDSYLAPGGPESSFHIPLQPPYVEFNTFTGRALLNWTPTPRDLFYVTVSRGYKPGGTTPFADVYAPEYVLNTEGGWKGNILDGRVRPAISLFSMDYKNYQATIATDPNNPTLDVTENVKGTTVKGVEAQLNGQFGAFGFDGALSYLDAKYGNLTIFEPAGAEGGGLPSTPIPVNLGNRQLDYAPKFSATIGGSYTYHLPTGDMVASMRYKYQSSQFTYFYDLPYDKIPSHGTVDMRISYQANAHWRAEVYGSNIFNKVYINNTVQETNGVGEYSLGAPSEFGFKLGYTF